MQRCNAKLCQLCRRVSRAEFRALNSVFREASRARRIVSEARCSMYMQHAIFRLWQFSVRTRIQGEFRSPKRGGRSVLGCIVAAKCNFVCACLCRFQAEFRARAVRAHSGRISERGARRAKRARLGCIVPTKCFQHDVDEHAAGFSAAFSGRISRARMQAEFQRAVSAACSLKRRRGAQQDVDEHDMLPAFSALSGRISRARIQAEFRRAGERAARLPTAAWGPPCAGLCVPGCRRRGGSAVSSPLARR